MSAQTTHRTLFCVLAVAGCGLDVGTKWLAVEFIGGGISVVTRILSLRIDNDSPGPSLTFGALGLLAAAAIVYWVFFQGAGRSRILSLALGLVVGGAVGNCLGCLVYQRVGGFIYIEALDWPSFNVADVLLACGAALLAWQALFYELPAVSLKRQRQSDPDVKSARD